MLELNVKHNLPDFKAQMKRFGVEFERKTVRSAAQAAGQVFKKFLVAEAPSLKKPDRRKKNPRVAGVLKKSMYVAYDSKHSTRGRVRYVASFRKGKKAANTGRDAFYGRFLELGWTPRGPGMKLRGGVRSRALQRSRNLAGGARKYKFQFILPGFNRSKAAALNAFTKRIALRIAKESRKL